MQVFGKFYTKFDIEYLIEQYIYIEDDSGKITTDELEQHLKKRRKSIAGVIFLYNPTMSPVGYNNKTTLSEQGFKFDGKYHELNPDSYCNLFSSSIKDPYRGKLIEIKYLFNLNRANIEPTPILEEFESDLDGYNTQQLTRYDKVHNYQDCSNIRLNGKFVFFATGNRHNRHHKNIISYTQRLAAQASILGKEVIFMHDNSYSPKQSQELANFLPLIVPGKAKDARIDGFRRSFSTNPPTTQKLS